MKGPFLSYPVPAGSIPDVFSITINSWDDVVGTEKKQTESGGADPEPKQGTEEEKTGP